MKVTLFVDSLGPGGAERVLSLVASRWAERGHEVTVVTLTDPALDFYPLHPRMRRATIGLPGPATSRARAAVLNVRRGVRIRRYLRRHRADAVVSFMDRMNVLVLAATLGQARNVIVSERVDPRHQPVEAAVRIGRRMLYRRAALLVVQTSTVRSWAQAEMPTVRVRVIPNPVGSTFTPRLQEPGSHRFVAIGRLARQKGFDLLLNAFAGIAEALPDWSLHVYGEGEERPALERQAAQLGIADRVRLPGIVERTDQVLREADVFVLPSRYEGFPNVLLEALATGVPSVSFACPSGPEDIVVDRENGLLVPCGDQGGLGRAMLELAGDARLRVTLARKGTETVQRFQTDVVGGLWDEALACVPLQPPP
jgi:glycosyltransferase involved in cell wall biosynthesis